MSIIVMVASSLAFKRYFQGKSEEQQSACIGKMVLWCFMGVLALALIMGVAEQGKQKFGPRRPLTESKETNTR